LAVSKTSEQKMDEARAALADAEDRLRKLKEHNTIMLAGGTF
jgi:hypothetical protein